MVVLPSVIGVSLAAELCSNLDDLLISPELVSLCWLELYNCELEPLLTNEPLSHSHNEHKLQYITIHLLRVGSLLLDVVNSEKEDSITDGCSG